MGSVVRLGVVGGRRGASFGRALDVFREKVRLVAICDLDSGVRSTWLEKHPQIMAYERYEDLLESNEIDAVLLATPVPLHARQAIQALAAGKHVLSEVVAATTLDECWELVEAVEKSGLTYMMAENYCYMRPNMMILNMVQAGLFGDIVHAEGAYIHDTRNLALKPNRELTWRGELHRGHNRNRYPTHSLGPVAQWLRINRDGGDELATTATLVSDPFNMHRYCAEHLGDTHPFAQPDYFAQGDSSVSLIRSRKGALITLRVDSCSPRPHNMTHYALQGTKASYLSPRFRGEDPLIWIDGRSPGFSPPRDGRSAEWQSLWELASEFEHPRWRAWGEEARKAGHGGGDFFILEDFVNAVREGTPPPIDVYDAVTWSSLIPLSEKSVRQGGVPLEIPRFRPKTERVP